MKSKKVSNKCFKRVSGAILAGLMAASVCCVLPINWGMNKAAAEEVVVQEAAESSVVVSYMDVFENYYMQACDQLQEKNITMPFTLDQFSEAYYTHDMDIAEYTQTVVSYVK